MQNPIKFTGEFKVECRGSDGQLKWVETFPNQVATTGSTEVLDKAFRGSSYTAAWYMGIITGPGAGNTYDAGDTMASHAGWAEDETYAEGARPGVTFAAASAGSIATSAASEFSINGAVTVAGAFLTTDDTKGGAAGVLYSAGNFTGGDRAVTNGDIIAVSYTTTGTV